MLEIERTMPSKNFSTSCKWTKLEYRICELNSMGFRVELDSNSDHFPWSPTHTVRHMIFLQKLVKSLILNGVLTREFYDSISISKRDFQLLHLKKFTTDTIVDFNIKLSFIVLVFFTWRRSNLLMKVSISSIAFSLESWQILMKINYKCLRLRNLLNEFGNGQRRWTFFKRIIFLFTLQVSVYYSKGLHDHAFLFVLYLVCGTLHWSLIIVLQFRTAIVRNYMN